MSGLHGYRVYVLADAQSAGSEYLSNFCMYAWASSGHGMAIYMYGHR
jgi:hypothetical protein